MSKRRGLIRCGALAVVSGVIGVLLAVPAHAAGGTVTFTDPNHDGYLNAAELSSLTDANGCATCVDADWTHTDSTAASATWTFTDNTGAVPPAANCTGSAAVDGLGFLNSSCASAMPEGTITFTVEWFDASNTSLGSASASLIKDTQGPTVSPSGLTIPAYIGPSNQSAVPVSGVAGTAGDPVLVAISDGTSTVSATLASGTDAAFSGTIDASSLAAGALTATAADLDAAGNPGTAITKSLTKDDTAPAKPSVSVSSTLITQGNEAAYPVTVAVAGEPEGGTATVTIQDNAATTTVTASGALAGGSVTIPVNVSSLPDTSSTVTLSATAQVVDAVGNVGATSDALALTKDATGPGAPSISSPVATLYQQTVTFSGAKGTPGGSIAIVKGGTRLATIPVPATIAGRPNTSGSWTQQVRLNSGTYSLSAVPIDSNGNLGTAADVPTFTVDATPPTVTIDSPTNYSVFAPAGGGTISGIESEPAIISGHAADQGLPMSSVIAVRVDVWDTHGVRVGCFYTSAPSPCPVVDPTRPGVPALGLGNTVTSQDATCALCTTPAQPRYDWSFDASLLQPGYYTITATSIDEAGNQSAEPAQINVAIL